MSFKYKTSTVNGSSHEFALDGYGNTVTTNFWLGCPNPGKGSITYSYSSRYLNHSSDVLVCSNVIRVAAVRTAVRPDMNDDDVIDGTDDTLLQQVSPQHGVIYGVETGKLHRVSLKAEGGVAHDASAFLYRLTLKGPDGAFRLRSSPNGGMTWTSTPAGTVLYPAPNFLPGSLTDDLTCWLECLTPAEGTITYDCESRYPAPGVYVTPYSHTVKFTAFKVGVTNIKFNHDTASSTNDAINIRASYAESLDIPDGEWNTGGMTNHPICYTTNILPTVKVRLTVEPVSITNVTLHAAVTNANPALFGLLSTNITFTSGVSVGDGQGYVTLTASNNIPSAIRKSIDTWQWNATAANGISAVKPFSTNTGPHTVYVIFNEPVEPWDNAYHSGTNKLNAWTNALDIVCSNSWANGATTFEDAAGGITRAIYESGRFQYDIIAGRCKYTVFDNDLVDYFYLTGWIERLNGNDAKPEEVNCWDCANGVVSLSNILGCDLWNQWIGSGFNCNEIKAISNKPWGKPFWGGFGYHRMGWRGPTNDTGRVFDACLKVDDSATPSGTSHTSERVPTDMLFGTGSAIGEYKFHLVAPGSYSNCSPSNPLPVGQPPGQRRDPIR